MSLKKQLAVAFVILLVVPMLLLGATSVIILGFQHGMIERGHFNADDGSVIYYVVRNESPDGMGLRMPVVQTVIFVGAVILLTAVVLVSWLYRSLIRPLNILRMATENIKEGNLDFTIAGDPDDELGRLCEDFEEMRLRLKEQIGARMKYEQDTIELISNISHDLKTPLTAIKGYTEGILDGVADTDEKREKYLRTIYAKASDMTALVDELSFYSKIDTNIVPYNFESIDICEFFSDCVDDLSLDMELKNVALTYENTIEGGREVAADTEQLRRVVNNIIGNAVKYMDKEHGIISIRSRQEGEFARIDIRDNGCGIPAEDIPHVFERFYRVDSSRGTRKGGTGLGLAIVKKIIEDHGGSVGVESVPGEGSTFTFTLPFRKETAVIYDEIEDADYSAAVGPRRLKGKENTNEKENTDRRG